MKDKKKTIITIESLISMWGVMCSMFLFPLIFDVGTGQNSTGGATVVFF